MSVTFEEQFKYRDESNLNAAPRWVPADAKNRCAATTS
jgi:hypothetical protein